MRKAETKHETILINFPLSSSSFESCENPFFNCKMKLHMHGEFNSGNDDVVDMCQAVVAAVIFEM